jgi:4-hydroxymandelate oxidase
MNDQIIATAHAQKDTAATAQSAPDPVCVGDFEALAKSRLSHMHWEYLRGGAQDEITARWNVEAFQRIRLQPKALVDVSRLSTELTLFGQKFTTPILLAPTGYHRLFHPDGELATVRGANAAGVTFVVSSMATVAIEKITAEATHPVWFQLYVAAVDREFSRDLIQRVEAAGCHAICLTVDAPVIGIRNFEQRVRFALPPGLELPQLSGLKNLVPHWPKKDDIYSFFAADLTWKDVQWLRSSTKLPFLLKGILNPSDAAIAAREGVDGIIVSNTGGRNLDTAPPTIEILPAIADAVAGRMPILLDGGIRRGSDVLKALALGASAVLVGRPYLYGLASSGAQGVTDVVNVLTREFKMTMALTGKTTLAGIGRDTIAVRGGLS